MWFGEGVGSPPRLDLLNGTEDHVGGWRLRRMFSHEGLLSVIYSIFKRLRLAD